MATKSRNLKRSNSLKTTTQLNSGFKNLNYDEFKPNENRFAARKTTALSRDFRNQAIFSRKFFRPFHSQSQIKRYDFRNSRVLAVLKDNFVKLRFERPIKEPVCRRRQARRQVLFAFRLTAKGAGALRHRWNDESRISCK